MPYATVDELRIYYEFTGPEEGPLILQFGGSLFGRQNFAMVNDGFRRDFRLLSYDASGYGRSDCPVENYTVEGWADEGAGLLDALGIEKALVHGTSMGGMVAVAFTAKYPEKTIAACADCAMARCDVYRRTMFRNWRVLAETLPLDELSRPGHDPGRLGGLHRGESGHLRERPLRDPQELAVHRPPGLPRDGADGSRAAGLEDPATDPVHERDPRRHDAAAARAVRLQCPGHRRRRPGVGPPARVPDDRSRRSPRSSRTRPSRSWAVSSGRCWPRAASRRRPAGRGRARPRPRAP